MKDIDKMSREEITNELHKLIDKIEHNQQHHPEIHNLPLFELCLKLSNARIHNFPHLIDSKE